MSLAVDCEQRKKQACWLSIVLEAVGWSCLEKWILGRSSTRAYTIRARPNCGGLVTDKRQLIATVEIVANPADSEARQRLRILALDAEFRIWLQELAAKIEPRGLPPPGNRLISASDMAKWLGGSANWHERHRQRYIEAGLLVRASGNRRYVGDLRKIQEAIGYPEFWADPGEDAA